MTQPVKVNRFLPGQMVTLVATFVGTDGLSPVDPSYVQVSIMDPTRAVACYAYGQANASVGRAGVGAYFKDVSVPRAGSSVGSWFYDWVATGYVQAVSGWAFIVDHDQALGGLMVGVWVTVPISDRGGEIIVYIPARRGDTPFTLAKKANLCALITLASAHGCRSASYKGVL